MLMQCLFRILLEAPKIATDLFLIKLSTCKGLVCLVAFLGLFKESWTLDTCIVFIMLLSVLSLVVHKMSKSDKISKSILAYLSLCNLLFLEVLVWELWFGVKQPEAGVNMHTHIIVLTFKSYPSQHKTRLLLWALKSFPVLSFAECTSHCICLPFWCQSASVASFCCHFQVPCFSSKAFPKISCTQNTTGRDLCNKWYVPTRV
jgi:hypothetical protein